MNGLNSEILLVAVGAIVSFVLEPLPYFQKLTAKQKQGAIVLISVAIVLIWSAIDGQPADLSLLGDLFAMLGGVTGFHLTTKHLRNDSTP